MNSVTTGAATPRVRAALAAIDAVDRPEIWITLRGPTTCWPRPPPSTPRWPAARTCRWPGSCSRSRTTSTSPASPRRRRAPASPTLPAEDADGGGPAARRRRAGARRDQPGPVRHRAGRHPQPLRRGPRRPPPGPHLRRIQFRLRRGRRAGPGGHRDRHRHRRLGPGPGRAAGHRRHQADPGRRPHRRRGAGLPVLGLRHRLRPRPVHRRTGDGRHGRRTPGLAGRHPAGGTGDAPRRLPGSPAGAAGRMGGGVRPQIDRLRAPGVDAEPIELDAFLEAARLLYDGALVAERHAAVGAFIDAADAGRRRHRRASTRR